MSRISLKVRRQTQSRPLPPLTYAVRDTDRGGVADIISTVEFDHTGNYLATGDKGGRVVLFERNETVYLAALDPLLAPMLPPSSLLPFFPS
jgi:hypothetical protein